MTLNIDGAIHCPDDESGDCAKFTTGLAEVLKLAPTMGKDETIVLCLSGRGDKDVESVGRYLGLIE